MPKYKYVPKTLEKQRKKQEAEKIKNFMWTTVTIISVLGVVYYVTQAQNKKIAYKKEHNILSDVCLHARDGFILSNGVRAKDENAANFFYKNNCK